MIIPDSALPYIRLQRTAYGSRDVREAYAEDMEAEYEMLAPYLPLKCARILDIGCGVAGIDVHLWQHYHAGARLFLLDRSEVARRPWYGFRKEGAFYNSLSVACQLLMENGVPVEDIAAIEASPGRLCLPSKVDLVLSLYSWGYHYPVSTYLDAVRRVLAPGATVIVDVREGTDGVRDLEALGRVEVVRHFNKSARCVVRKEE